ncbi:glutamine-dependent NAD(+) synthetase [Nilaparvata lugens]|uniref:glutamine-dependent NAD(+) synthetase n=1 Tax=Nilaparvata lugens TaxID=108931 RepID=UPI00193D24AA|nr:glutamine-dependent NAD(+) synthetase [Nilaparvata lugens]
MRLCDNGNYRESRWFTEWRKPREVEDDYLPRIIATYTGQSVVAFGDAVSQLEIPVLDMKYVKSYGIQPAHTFQCAKMALS